MSDNLSLDDLDLPDGFIEEDLSDWDEEGYEFDDDFDMADEVVVGVVGIAEGLDTLQMVAERLYDYADELLSMSAAGYELVDGITDGQSIAIMTDYTPSD